VLAGTKLSGVVGGGVVAALLVLLLARDRWGENGKSWGVLRSMLL